MLSLAGPLCCTRSWHCRHSCPRKVFCLPITLITKPQALGLYICLSDGGPRYPIIPPDGSLLMTRSASFSASFSSVSMWPETWTSPSQQPAVHAEELQSATHVPPGHPYCFHMKLLLSSRPSLSDLHLINKMNTVNGH